MKIRTALAALCLSVFANAGVAAYPERPVRVLIPYPPGGAVDVVTRKLCEQLTKQTGKAFVVENRPGGGSTIASTEVARAKPDGYTLLALDNSYPTLPYAFKNLRWDHSNGLIPITVTAFTPVMLVVAKDSPFATLSELLSKAKEAPETLTAGVGGAGGSVQFSTLAFEQAADVKFMLVPYKGASESILGVISGQVNMVLLSTPSVASQIKSGLVRPLAVSGKNRLPQYPGTPTFAQAGLPGYSTFNWSGLAAPAGTPSEVVNFLQREVVKALQADEMKDFLASMSAQPGGLSPSEFSQMIRDETVRWGNVARKANLQPQ
jgi:Uncharacterized protein conserved in bacteria